MTTFSRCRLNLSVMGICNTVAVVLLLSSAVDRILVKLKRQIFSRLGNILKYKQKTVWSQKQWHCWTVIYFTIMHIYYFKLKQKEFIAKSLTCFLYLFVIIYLFHNSFDNKVNDEWICFPFSWHSRKKKNTSFVVAVLVRSETRVENGACNGRYCNRNENSGSWHGVVEGDTPYEWYLFDFLTPYKKELMFWLP